MADQLFVIPNESNTRNETSIIHSEPTLSNIFDNNFSSFPLSLNFKDLPSRKRGYRLHSPEGKQPDGAAEKQGIRYRSWQRLALLLLAVRIKSQFLTRFLGQQLLPHKLRKLWIFNLRVC